MTVDGSLTEIVEPEAGLFVSCPGDAEHLASLALDIYRSLREVVGDAIPSVHYWRKDFDPFDATAAAVTQLQIARTSSDAVDPVVVLFSNTVGTPVALPASERSAMRARLDDAQFHDVAILGDDGFRSIQDLTADQVPLTGTLFELFDACLPLVPGERGVHGTPGWSLPRKQVRVIFADQPGSVGSRGAVRSAGAATTDTASEAAQAWARQQRIWLDRFRTLWSAWRTGLSEETYRQTHGLLVDSHVLEDSPTGLRALVETALRQATGIPALDPWQDELPGLDAVMVERRMMLGGREQDIRDLTEKVLASDGCSVTVLHGESGAGKSSLLRAGLLGALSRSLPMRTGRIVALVAEPGALVRHGDPVGTLLAALAGQVGGGALPHLLSDPDRERLPGRRELDGPYPGQLGDLASVLQSRKADAGPLSVAEGLALLHAALPDASDGPMRLMLSIDQWEQIDTAARRLRRRRQEESGRDDIPLEMPEAEQTLLGLLGALSRLGAPGRTPALAEPPEEGLNDLLEQLGRKLRVSLVLSVPRHRLATTGWLLDVPREPGGDESGSLIRDAGAEVLEALPLASPQQFREVVKRVFAAYGFVDPDNRLATALADQAAEVVRKAMHKDPDAGGGATIWTGQVSVMPLLSITLVQMLQRWQALFDRETGPGRELDPQARLQLDPQWFEGVDRIDGAVATAGESAWSAWADAETGSRGQELGLLSGQRFVQELEKRFAQLFDRLAYREGVEPTLIEADRVHDALVVENEGLTERLRQVRLMVPLPGERLRLTHAVIFEHWPRAAAWLESRDQAFDTRRRLRNHHRDYADDPFRADDLPSLVSLLHDWPGSGLGDDGELRAYLGARLLQQIDWSEGGEGEAGMALFVSAMIRQDWDLVAGIVERLGQVRTPSPDLLQHLLIGLAESGQADLVRTVLALGVDPDTVHEESGTFPLLQAAQEGHAEVVDALLAAGASPDQVDEQARTFPLLMAAQNGHAAVVAALLASGAMPDRVNEQNGTFPLVMAAQNGHAAVVAALLDVGATPDQVHEQSGNFPLLLAAQAGHAEVVSALLAAGATPDRVNDKNGTFPLLQAAQNGHAAVVSALLAAGATPDRVNDKNGTFPLLQAAQEGHAGVVSALLAAGATPDQVNEERGTFPLLMAAQNGHAEVVSALLASGATPDQVNEERGTFPLLMAAQNGHAEVVSALLASGATPDRVNDKDGTFPLLMAAQYGHAEVVSALLAAGAPPDQVDEQDGGFPLLMAAQNGHAEVVAALLAVGATPDRVHERDGTFPLLQAAQNGHAEVVSALLAAGAPPDQVDEQDGGFPLLMAAQNGHAEVVSALLAAGAPPDQVHEQSGNFPLLLAAQAGHAAVVASLLAAGAPPDRINDRTGTFPLLLAAQNGHAAVVSALLAAGAPPDQVDEQDGGFPLLVAAQEGHAAVVSALLAAGAEATRRHQPSGIGAAEAALGKGELVPADLLIRAGASLQGLRDDLPEEVIQAVVQAELPYLLHGLLAAGVRAATMPDLPRWPVVRPTAFSRLPWRTVDETGLPASARLFCTALNVPVPAGGLGVMDLGNDVVLVRCPVGGQDPANAGEWVMVAGPEKITLAGGGSGGLLRCLDGCPAPARGEDALDYLVAFCSLLVSGTDLFAPILEPEDLTVLTDTPGSVPDLVEPPEIAWDADQDRWRASFCVLHDGTLYRSVLTLAAGGRVEMLDDRPLASELVLRSPLAPVRPEPPRATDTASGEGQEALPPVPGLPILGWPEMPDAEPGQDDVEQIVGTLLRQSLPQGLEVRGVQIASIGARGLENWSAVTVVEAGIYLQSDKGMGAARLAWLQVDHDGGKEILPAAPGDGLLDRLLVDISVPRNLRSHDEAARWAELVVVLAAVAGGLSRRPIGEDAPMPLLPDQEMPQIATREVDWRRRDLRPMPDAIIVTLPWLVGRTLVRGQVLVTRDGRGCRIVDERIIARDLPVWAEHAFGPVRLMSNAK